jgi:hypothetical protein
MIQKAAKKSKKVVSDETRKARDSSWSSYSEHYEKRYGVKPIRSAKENTAIARLVESVGQQDSPFLVQFYLSCGDDYLVTNCHPLTLLAANPNSYIVRKKNGWTHKKPQQNSFQNKQDSRKLPSFQLSDKYSFKWADGCEPEAQEAEEKTNAQ